jgi:hypothetical protein
MCGQHSRKTKLQHKNTYALGLLLIVALSTIFAVTFMLPLTRVTTVSAVESVTSVGVYWDVECENSVHSLDWGNLSPSSTRKISVYIRNEGNEPITLNLLTENWSPLIAAQDISLSWDYQGYPIYANQVIVTELALSVSPGITGVTSFTFDIRIGSESQTLSLGEVAEEKILNAPANMVYFIYADPAYMTRAEATYDVTSGESIRNICVNNQHYGFNTTQYWLLPSGAINTTTINNATIAMFGGRCPNMAMRYYETVREITPVKFEGNSTHLWFENQEGAILAALPQSALEVPNYHEDMFTAMIFYDEVGDNIFFVMYGIDWKGTWACGIYFKEVISNNLSAYTNDYYVFRWIDDNEQDGIPQSSEIHLETSG